MRNLREVTRRFSNPIIELIIQENEVHEDLSDLLLALSEERARLYFINGNENTVNLKGLLSYLAVVRNPQIVHPIATMRVGEIIEFGDASTMEVSWTIERTV